MLQKASLPTTEKKAMFMLRMKENGREKNRLKIIGDI
jgi:hypothetical protein